MDTENKDAALYSENIDSRFLHLRKDRDIQIDDIRADIEKGNTPTVYFWEGSVVYHDKEYVLCSEFNIPYRKVNLALKNEAAVTNWICREELTKDDLTDTFRKYLIGKRYNSLIKIDDGRPLFPQGVLQKNLGLEYSVSTKTMRKYSQYANSIDFIRWDDPKAVLKVLNEDIKISDKEILEIAYYPTGDAAAKFFKTYGEGPNEKFL